MPRRPQELFSAAELARLTEKSDWYGAWALLSTWAAIAAIFAVVAWQPHALTAVLGVILLGGRQLALAVLQHEGAHRTLFRSRWLNDVATDWLAARPIWLNQDKYRQHHIGHHRHTGTDLDADVSLRTPYPTSRRSLTRKLLRDASGLTGVKLIVGLLMMDLGLIKWTVTSDVQKLPQAGRGWRDYAAGLWRNTGPVVFTNGVLLAALAAAGQAWLYGLWVLAFITAFPLVTRIRSIAEHACLEEGPDIFRNTRTTRAGWLARVLVAPLHVNYHLEHHLLMSVPYYRLPLMHRLLRDKGLADAAGGYLDVLKVAGSAPA